MPNDSGCEESGPPDDALVEHAVALHTTAPDDEPTTPAEDLAPLAPALRDSTVVGLGEATHGTREFFQLKHRLIRFLVEEHGLRTVALEADPVAARAVDDYVTRGEGDPREAIAGFHVFLWEVESVLALVEWLRSYNADRPGDDRVHVYGIDAQYTTGAVAELRSFLARVDEEYLASIDESLSVVDDHGQPPGQRDPAVEDDHLAAMDRLVDDLGDRLEEREAEYVAATDREAWRWARHLVRRVGRVRERTAAQHADDLQRSMAVRDRAMADAVDWLLEGGRGGSGGADRVAVSAHNGHVNRVENRARDETAPSMGAHLADRHGEDYYALGFTFGGGSFQAFADPPDDLAGTESDEGSVEDSNDDAHAGDESDEGQVDDSNDDESGGDGFALRECTLATALDGTVGNDLAVADHPVLDDHPAVVLDFAAARGDPAVDRWLDAPARFQSVGWRFVRDDPSYHVEEYAPGAAFDGLCYVPGTTRARPLDG